MVTDISPEELRRLSPHREQPWSELDRYDRASPALDCVLLTVRDGSMYVLIQRRENPPDNGAWALPGVFLNFKEPIEAAVSRAVAAKTGLKFDGYREQLEYRVDPFRDPRGWVTTVAYLLLAPFDRILAQVTRQDALLARIEVSWLGETGGPADVFDSDGGATQLAFDHAMLVGAAIRRLRGKLNYTNIGLELMPAEFTLRDLRLTYEAILGRKLNRASFQRQVVEVQQLIQPTGEMRTDVSYRPAALYRPSHRR